MNHIFLMSESPEAQLKTNIIAGEEWIDVRKCKNDGCIGWSKNLDMEICPFCKGKMAITQKKTPQIQAVNSCRNCFYLVKSENLCMKKQKKLSFHASDHSEDCSSYKMERKATKKERLEKEQFLTEWKERHSSMKAN